MKSVLSHVALLVSSVEKSAAYLQSLGVETGEPELFDREGTKEIYVGSYEKQSGLLLLLEAVGEGPYQIAFAKRGATLHHLAIDVLDLSDFTAYAEAAGWVRHPISTTSISHNTVWLYRKGVPALIEINQKSMLSVKPSKIGRLEIPMQPDHELLFAAIGLKDKVVRASDQFILTLDSLKLHFEQIANPV